MIREQLQFDHRVRQLSRKHDAIARGYLVKLRSDGLIETKPRRPRRRISLMPILLFVAAFIAFKGLMIASVGFGTYEDRLTRLQSGTAVEQAGAWLMGMDPVALGIAEKIKPYLP